MPIVTRTIIVDAPIELTFDISNQIESWPEMMAEYKAGEVFQREGRKMWFRLIDVKGNQWTSWRMLYRPLFAYAERHEPKAPFIFMHITWSYRAIDEARTEMTWDMSFELADDKRALEAQWVEGMGRHTEANQAQMKAYIEARALSPSTTRS